MEDTSVYTVIIGDISGSRQLSGMDRYQTQLFVKSAIVQINEQFSYHVEAPMTITKGDEFQGLIDTPSNAYKIIHALQKMVFPIRIRYGIGIGTIFRMGGKLPIEMDGPAFHRANRALTQAKKHRVDMWLISENECIDQLINTSFLLISAIKSRWNERHFRLYWSYQELGTYREVAEAENVTPQAICDTLRNIRATDIMAAERNLRAVFDKLMLIADVVT
ncbi:MAG: SatD family protein [Calditrichia bacterium]